MNSIKKVYYRAFQGALKSLQPLYPYRDPLILNHLESLPKELSDRGINRVLILTDKKHSEDEMVESLKSFLKNEEISYFVFDSCPSQPTIQSALEAAILYLKEGVDAMIAVGDGSVIDCAKAAGAKVAYPGKPLTKMSNLFKVRRKTPPLIAIPTIPGSGSEASLATVVTNPNTNDYFVIIDFFLIPDIAVLDSNHGSKMSKEEHAVAGMEAFSQAVEAYIGRLSDVEGKRSSEDAIRIIANNFIKSYESDDREACDEMLFAAFLGGRALNRGAMGYVYALSHAISALYDIPTGVATAVMLPLVLEASRPKIDKALHKLAIIAEVSDEEDSTSVGADKFLKALKDLRNVLELPETLTELQLEDIPKIAAMASRRANPLYPVPVLMDENELAALLVKASANKI